MKTTRRSGLVRRRTSRRRGAAVVEMAVVTPLLLLMLFGIIEFGWVFMVQNTLTNAAREACRVGVLQGTTDQDIRDRFNEAVSVTGLDDSVLTITQATQNNPVVTVRVSLPYEQISLLGSYLGLGGRNIGTVCSMRKEGEISG